MALWCWKFSSCRNTLFLWNYKLRSTLQAEAQSSSSVQRRGSRGPHSSRLAGASPSVREANAMSCPGQRDGAGLGPRQCLGGTRTALQPSARAAGMPFSNSEAGETAPLSPGSRKTCRSRRSPAVPAMGLVPWENPQGAINCTANKILAREKRSPPLPSCCSAPLVTEGDKLCHVHSEGARWAWKRSLPMTWRRDRTQHGAARSLCTHRRRAAGPLCPADCRRGPQCSPSEAVGNLKMSN